MRGNAQEKIVPSQELSGGGGGGGGVMRPELSV